jgi:hypothetical protein
MLVIGTMAANAERLKMVLLILQRDLRYELSAKCEPPKGFGVRNRKEIYIQCKRSAEGRICSLT